jgi:hypothetical protein
MLPADAAVLEAAMRWLASVEWAHRLSMVS